MDSPYLERGESIILTTDRVSINSAQYDVLLTTRYLILVDVRYARFQPQKIPLLAILSVKGGRIATGDLVITLSFSDTSLTGTGQMNLIFSRYPDEQRDRERDEWLKKLMERIVAVRQETIGSKTIAPEQGIGIRPVTRRTIAPEMQPPHTTIINIHPEPVELRIIHDEPESPAAEEPAEPVTTADTMPPEVTLTGEEPADTEPHTLPESSEAPALQEEPVEPVSIEGAIPTEEKPPEEEPHEIKTDTEPHILPESSEPPALQGEPVELISTEDVMLPGATLTERPDTTIPDRESSDISERSKPPDSPEEPAESVSITDIAHPEASLPEEDLEKIITGTASQALPESSIVPAPPEEPGVPVSIPGVTIPEVTPPREEPEKQSSAYHTARSEPAVVELPPEGEEEVLPPEEEAIPAERSEAAEPVTQPAAEIPPGAPGSPPPPVIFRGYHKTVIIAIGILILGIACAMVLYPEYLASPEKGIFPIMNPAVPETTLPVPSTQMTSAPTQVIIPPTGVWVRVTYPRNYYGRLGNPGSLRGITGSGDRFYQMDEKNRLVQVQVYKTDNAGDILTVELYRNGEIIHRRSTTSPMGVIELLIDAETGNPPGITPPGVTQTVNQTAPPGSNQTGAVHNQTVLNPVNATRTVVNPSISSTGNQTGSGSQTLYF